MCLSLTLGTSNLTWAGFLAGERKDFRDASAWCGESLTLFRELNDPRGVGHALRNLGLIASGQGDRATALALFEEALSLFRERGDKKGVALTLLCMGLMPTHNPQHIA